MGKRDELWVFEEVIVKVDMGNCLWVKMDELWVFEGVILGVDLRF
jgi:hypothetical protein